ncbi:MAG: oligosaccharyl transferase, archaeosortase A system-associated [Candidatus Methanoperedens sp.]|nr:oligosaccharyl transferase, archaeosortase A system-associated [Candidatus Methanoperedens sp.]
MTKKNQIKIDNAVIYLLIIILISLIVRLFTYSQVFEQGRIVFLETDPYYHMWRVFSYIGMFPKTFLFDPYINYPYGATVGWPPLFDQGIALLSIIVGLGKPDVHLVELTGAFIPVLLGVLSVIAVYYIAKEIFNEKIAIYSSILLAVMPAHAQISFLGFTDHHIAEVLLSVLAYLFFIRSLKGSSRYAILSGIFIGISLLTWIGAPIFIGILLSYSALQFILDKKSGAPSNYIVRAGIISFSTALLIMLVFYLWTPWQKTITTATLSYFQLIYLVISAAVILLFGAISSFMKKQKWYFYPVSIGIIIILFLLFLILAIPSFYQSISGGIGYLLRDAPVLKQISEAQPLFYTYDGIFLGWQWDKNPVWYSFTFSFYVAIIGLIWFLYSNRNGIDSGKLFFAIWTLVNFILALSQRRFTYMLAINIAILTGFSIYEVLERTRHSESRNKMITFAVSIVLIFVLFIPNIAVSYQLSGYPPKPSDDWYDSLVWLEQNTPETGNNPKYGIMTWWDYGNWILYISKRPVVANNFQIGGDEAARFYLADNETLASSIMDARKARYVIVDRRMGLNKYMQGNQLVITGTFFAVADFADKNPGMYLDKYNLPHQNYFQTMYSRLHVFDGNGLKSYRMIYESKEKHYNLFDKPTQNIKIFEYVKGARITGNASSNETAYISGKIITNQNRQFEYIQEIKANEKGYFELVVPYSSDSHYETRLLKNYELTFSNSNISVNVSENDVLSGNIIKVN